MQQPMPVAADAAVLIPSNDPITSSSDQKGLLLVLSGPSGCGKTTLARMLVKNDSRIVQSISVTTRPPRSGETDGADYLFVSEDRFNELLDAGELAEHAEVYGYRYGTLRFPLEERMLRGGDTVLVLDVQGRRSLSDRYRGRMVSVYLLPPSIEALRQRLHSRGQDSSQVITRRLAEAPAEMQLAQEYGHVLQNDDMERSLELLQTILRVNRNRRQLSPTLFSAGQ